MFTFLLYVRPTWYYRLPHQSSAPILADYHKLDSTEKNFILYDSGYSNQEAANMDAAYQGLNRGIIPTASNALSTDNISRIDSVRDNYRFIRKYFGTHWYLYTYAMRMLTFKNPIWETYHFLRNLNTPKGNFNKNVNRVAETFIKREYSLQNTNCPLVTVVIPTLNRYPYLKDVLSDLEKQDYLNFEVIVCDQSDPLDAMFYEGWNLNLHLIQQQEKALWLARNESIKKAKGEWILLFDDDSRVESDWISRHMQCIQHFEVKISAGVTHTLVGHGLSSKETYFHLSDVFDTGNALVHKDVFREVGLFDRQFEKQRMGDGEFGLRALLGGYQIISNPLAKRIHLKVDTGGLRQMGSWDALRPKQIFAPRPVPSVLYFFRKYFGAKAAVFYLVQNLPVSFIPYRLKKSKSLKYIFTLFMPLLLPLFIVVAIKSWKLASYKLTKGSLIGPL